jgi:hypothetical protein
VIPHQEASFAKSLGPQDPLEFARTFTRPPRLGKEIPLEGKEAQPRQATVNDNDARWKYGRAYDFNKELPGWANSGVDHRQLLAFQIETERIRRNAGDSHACTVMNSNQA